MLVCRYNTYIAHYKEAECFRVAIENMLYDAGVDMVFSGGHMCLLAKLHRFKLNYKACMPYAAAVISVHTAQVTNVQLYLS